MDRGWQGSIWILSWLSLAFFVAVSPLFLFTDRCGQKSAPDLPRVRKKTRSCMVVWGPSSPTGQTYEISQSVGAGRKIVGKALACQLGNATPGRKRGNTTWTALFELYSGSDEGCSFDMANDTAMLRVADLLLPVFRNILGFFGSWIVLFVLAMDICGLIAFHNRTDTGSFRWSTMFLFNPLSGYVIKPNCQYFVMG